MKTKALERINAMLPEEMQAVIEAYFVDIEKTKAHPTLSGVALRLGVERRDLLRAVDPRIKQLRTRIEAEVEALLLKRNFVIGPIFWLKNNAGWSDKYEFESRTFNQSVSINYIVPKQAKLPDEVKPGEQDDRTQS